MQTFTVDFTTTTHFTCMKRITPPISKVSKKKKKPKRLLHFSEHRCTPPHDQFCSQRLACSTMSELGSRLSFAM